MLLWLNIAFHVIIIAVICEVRDPSILSCASKSEHFAAAIICAVDNVNFILLLLCELGHTIV
jgi:hypothetical protein